METKPTTEAEANDEDYEEYDDENDEAEEL